MNSDIRPHRKLSDTNTGDRRHSKLIVCGAVLRTDASVADESVQPFEIDLERVSDLFLSECDEPTALLEISERQRDIADTRRQIAEHSPTEHSIFMIVPAGAAVPAPDHCTPHRSGASTTTGRLSLAALARSLTTSTVHALGRVGRLALSIAWTVATRTRLLAARIVVAVAAAIASRMVRLAPTLRSAEQIATAAGHSMRSAMASLPGTVDSVARRGFRQTIQSAQVVTRAVARHATEASTRAGLAVTSLRTCTLHIRYRAPRFLNHTERTSTEHGGSVLSRLQAPLPYPGGRQLAVLQRSFVATVAAILVGIAAVGIGTFEPQPGRLAASSLVDPTTIVASLRAPVRPFTPVYGPRSSLKDGIGPAAETLTNQTPATVRVTTTAAIQRVLNRYRDAFSTLDDRAVQGVWPSVDVRGLRTDFARLYDQNLDYESCDITVRADDASAVCRGIVQSIASSTRITRRDSRRWRFVLRKVNDRWLIDAVDVS